MSNTKRNIIIGAIIVVVLIAAFVIAMFMSSSSQIDEETASTLSSEIDNSWEETDSATFEEVNNENTMDREKLKNIAADFITAYYSGESRRAAMEPFINESALTNNDDSMFYKDYMVKEIDSSNGAILKEVNEVSVDNAQQPNATVRVVSTVMIPTYSDPGESGEEPTQGSQEMQTTMQIHFDKDYKVVDVSFAGSESL